MPQAPNAFLYILTPKSFHLNKSLLSIKGIFKSVELPHANLIKFNHSVTDIGSNLTCLKKNGYVKFFENYWVLSDMNSETDGSYVKDFFSYIATKYESNINYSNNLACYEFLIETAHKLKDTPHSNVLDFGSGTGISMETQSFSKLDSVVGYDFSAEMREISLSKGLTTFDTTEFDSLSSSQFDIIVLNYVLHLQISIDSLMFLLDLLVNGGILIGNIHKDLGIKSISIWLSSLVQDTFSYKFIKSKYGSVIIVKRIA